MATAVGTFHFIGKSGQSYSVSAYFPDTVGNPVRFNQAGLADVNSPTDWTPPEQVALADILMNSNVATPTAVQVARNGQPTGDIFATAMQLVSVVARIPMRIVFSPLMKVSGYMR